MRRKCRALMLEGYHSGNEKRTGTFNKLRWWGLWIFDNGRAKSRTGLLHQQPRADLRIERISEERTEEWASVDK